VISYSVDVTQGWRNYEGFEDDEHANSASDV